MAYCTVGSNRLIEAKSFYDDLLRVAGLTPLFDHPSGGRVYGSGDDFSFGLLGPFDGGPASIGNGSMVGFRFESRQEVDDFHARALDLGGRTEGGPAERGPGWYFAYFRDLDGNKLCGYCTSALPMTERIA
jgi:catechol 2,3-dioxygenase-like lactoylglutathione lyase family enzyme